MVGGEVVCTGKIAERRERVVNIEFFENQFFLFGISSISISVSRYLRVLLFSNFYLTMLSTNCTLIGCKSMKRKHVFSQNDDDYNMWLQRCNNDKSVLQCWFVIYILIDPVTVKEQKN